jgi:hypothetical protein
MKRTFLLAGAALAAVVVAVAAHAEQAPQVQRERREVRIEEHMARIGRIDANSDGFVTRAEAQAEAERMFGEMDGDNNGKLDAADRGMHRRIMIHRMDDDGPGDREVRVTREKSGDTVIERREVEIRREGPKEGHGRNGHGHGGGHGRGMHPPMMGMMLLHSSEADRNGDGALSKDEFVSQQLRFFDASDVNGDGKIKFERPPAPPRAPDVPQPPAPPQPPRR